MCVYHSKGGLGKSVDNTNTDKGWYTTKAGLVHHKGTNHFSFNDIFHGRIKQYEHWFRRRAAPVEHLCTCVQLMQLGQLVQCWKGEKTCLVPSTHMHVFTGFHRRDSSQRRQ